MSKKLAWCLYQAVKQFRQGNGDNEAGDECHHYRACEGVVLVAQLREDRDSDKIHHGGLDEEIT
jgi:hypothetical protein